MADLVLQAPAKLNLFLHITGQRDDGYHTLQTVFQLIDFYDTLEFFQATDKNIVIESSVDIRPSQNIIVRAAHALQKAANIQEGIKIHLQKRLPICGGLGGGSSDAAATLLGLNTLWRLNFSVKQLANIGVKLGADIPVFVHAHSAFAEGVGEQLTPLDLPSQNYLLVIPPIHVTTKEIFAHPDLPRTTKPIKLTDYHFGFGRNDCETLVRKLYPDIDRAFELLEQFGQPRLSGTGSTVYLATADKAKAEEISKLIPQPFATIVTHGINTSTARITL